MVKFSLGLISGPFGIPGRDGVPKVFHGSKAPLTLSA